MLFYSRGISRRKKLAWDMHGRHFIFAMQQNLLKSALAPWPRREAPLLEVNCGDGAFLPILWRYGFDIFATENNAELMTKARKRNYREAQLFAAPDHELPFENDEFDWVILHLAPIKSKTISEAVQEALRVGKRGIMITFWNNASLAGLFERNLFKRACGQYKPLAWWQVWKIGANLQAGRLSMFSTLNGPAITWHSRCPLAIINGWLEKMPLGAWCIMRIDLGHMYPLTPLPLRIRKSMPQTEPVMEFGQENFRTKKLDS